MSTIAPDQFVEILRTVSSRIDEAREMLGELDGAIGDADHGRTMSQGFASVVRDTQDAASKGSGVQEILGIAARTFLNAVGATAGPLYAGAFEEAGRRMAGRHALEDADLIAILAGMTEGIARRGKAALGDKTMLDAFEPAMRAAVAATEAGASPRDALRAASLAAAQGRETTRAMIAAKGRAARLGARSLGFVDPGAASAAIVVEAMREGYEALLARRAGER
ncbi:dihydroxyacetone kinase subunit DhaL [Aureimonas sp. SK2]|uniref:dihydroxyacetone kinase subunit DhaL n=1 Tax=Aureimonas sp. SK2 TaxID=3015992 RepID=UPI002444AD8A|nr:dihydroxyacetone kinase subunit DhaL [Aureimonas sp. SK2]